MEKECEICGAWFEVTRPNRKYCDKCMQKPEKYKKEYGIGMRQSIRRMYVPTLFTGTCEQCGKEFTTKHSLRFHIPQDQSHPEELVFCSRKCKEAYLIDHAVCRHCGKILLGSSYYDGSPETQFCNENCHDEYKRKIERQKYEEAKRNGDLHVCLHCGKEFIRKGGGKFCCRDCYLAAKDKGWRPEKITSDEYVYRKEACPECGRIGMAKYKLPLPEVFPVHFCSKACKEKYMQKKQKEKAIVSVQSATSPQHSKNAKTKPEAKSPKKPEPLCATCKTSYLDCERMQSEFRILPKGAKYNMDGVLTVCPKYT